MDAKESRAKVGGCQSQSDVMQGKPEEGRRGREPAGGGFRRWLKLGRGAEINPVTGGLRIDPDLHLPSRGMPVDIEFYYYSQDAHDGPFGYGRNMSCHRWIRKDVEAGSASIYTGTGEVLVYTKNDGGYDPPAGTFDTLNQAGDGSWSEVRAGDQAYFAYDVIDENGASRCISINDLNGNTHALVWDESGPFEKLSKLVDAAGRAVYFNYDANNRLSHMIDWGDRRQTFTYDASGNLNKVIGPTGCVTYYNYDANHNLIQLVDPEGYSTEWEYDDFTPPRVIRLTRPGDAHTYFNYSSVDDRLEVTIDALGNRTSYQWDGNGDLIASTNPVGGTTSYEYSNRLVTLEIDPNGNRTTYQHDSSGNTLTEISPIGAVTYYHYDGGNRVTVEIDPLGNRTSYTYDGKGNRTAVEDPLNRVTYYNYDAYGQPAMEVNGMDKVTYYNYDVYGSHTQIIDPLGNRTSFQHDAVGNIIAQTNPGGEPTYYQYDEMNRPTLVIDPLGNRTTSAYDGRGNQTIEIGARGHPTTYTYDGNSNLAAVQDGRGNLTTYVYDKQNQQTTVVDALGQRTSYGYDAAGRQEWRLDAKGQRTTYVYDVGGRRTRIEYSDGTRVTFSYDAADRRTKMEDSIGVTTYTYDDLDQPRTAVYPPNNTITYSYDAVGNRATMVDPDGGITTYSYDSRNLLYWLQNPAGERTTWLYDDAGRPTTMTYGNSAIAETDYDRAGQITAVRNLKSDRTVLSIFTYTYDDAGNRTAVAEANGDRVTWSYDELYQLTSEQRSGSNGYAVFYSYDEVGNRLTRNEDPNLVTYTYDEANQLTVEENPSARITYSYDANGNTEVINGAGNLTTYSWNIENRMTVAQLPAGGRTTATYDGDGKRRSCNDSGGLKNILWDGETILFETDSADTTLAQYTLAPQGYGSLISQRRGGASSFHHFDALGSTERLTDASQSTLISYLYRAFGEQIILSGSHSNPFSWVGALGYCRQPDTSDYWVRARVYRPQMGRWVSRDPLARWPTYLYARNRPITAVDPTGLQCPSCWDKYNRLRAQAFDQFNRCTGRMFGYGVGGDVVACAAGASVGVWVFGVGAAVGCLVGVIGASALTIGIWVKRCALPFIRQMGAANRIRKKCQHG